MLDRLNTQVAKTQGNIDDIEKSIESLNEEIAELNAEEFDDTPIEAHTEEDMRREQDRAHRVRVRRESNTNAVVELVSSRARLYKKLDEQQEILEGKLSRRNMFLQTKNSIFMGRLMKVKGSLMVMSEENRKAIGAVPQELSEGSAFGAYGTDLSEVYMNLQTLETNARMQAEALKNISDLVKMVNTVYVGVDNLQEADPELLETFLNVFDL